MGFISDGMYQDRRAGKLVSSVPRCSSQTTKPKPHTPRPLSHINAIPPEILTDIFEFCQTQGQWTDPLIPTLESIVAVCNHWRAVALAAPYLWSRIKLYDPKEMHVPMVQRWLERSRSCPLTLGIHQVPPEVACGEDEPPLRVDDATKRILLLLSHHVARWRSLKLHLCHMTDIPKLPVSSTVMPLFESFEIDDFALTPSMAQEMWEAITSYSSMRRVTWFSHLDPKTYLPDPFNCQWGKLTHLTGRFSVDNRLLHLLEQCTSLVFLELREGHCCASINITTRTPFTMPALQTLKLHVNEDILDYLVLPALQEVALYSDGSRFRKWVDLFERSSCTLKSSTFSVDSRTEEEDLDIFLTSTSMFVLENLCAYESWTSDVLVRKLTSYSDKPILPWLRRLELGVYNCKEGFLKAMLSSWTNRQDTTLKSVDIVHGVYPHRNINRPTTDASFLQELRSNGLNVTYRGP